MKFIFRFIAVIIFVVFFVFALKNTGEVSLSFFSDYRITAPLVLMLLGFFAAGAVFGVIAMLPTVVRTRREATRQKQAMVALTREHEAQQQTRQQPPLPDSF